MSDDMTRADNEQQSGQKTIVAFIVGLLIGGLVVWMFSGAPAEEVAENGEQEATEEVSENETDDEAVSEDEDEDDTQADTSENTDDQGSTPSEQTSADNMVIGEGSVSISDQPASSRITLDAVTFPMSDGWIGVREYTNGNLGALLGVMRFSESEGLIPENIVLQRATTPGNEYAVVFYTAADSNQFNLGVNSQLDGIFATFTAE